MSQNTVLNLLTVKTPHSALPRRDFISFHLSQKKQFPIDVTKIVRRPRQCTNGVSCQLRSAQQPSPQFQAAGTHRSFPSPGAVNVTNQRTSILSTWMPARTHAFRLQRPLSSNATEHFRNVKHSLWSYHHRSYLSAVVTVKGSCQRKSKVLKQIPKM